MTPDIPSQAPEHWLVAWDEDLYERLANSGGPMSRRRTERLSATVLGRDEGAVRCPRVLRVGLDFGGRSPLTCVRELLKACGFSDEQEARAALALPLEPCLCRPDPAPSPAPVEIAAARTTRSTRRWCSGSAPRGATTRGGRCSGPAPA